MSVAWD